MPSFGDLSRSTVATLGLNPSNREFVDDLGNELDGSVRRFHTLRSLGIKRWSEASETHSEMIVDMCRYYFSRNPYDRWFKKLDQVIAGTCASYYSATAPACHLDLIPFATACKWTSLTRNQRAMLLENAGDTLGLLLADSPIRLLILNGRSVVEQFEDLAGIQLDAEQMKGWALPRRRCTGVAGFAYRGVVRRLAGIQLESEIVVLGFNHNIQSSFGVTGKVIDAIRLWIAKAAAEVLR